MRWNGPKDWQIFVSRDYSIATGSTYCSKDHSYGEDYDQLEVDVAVGKPEAVRVMSRFVTYQLTGKIPATED